MGESDLDLSGVLERLDSIITKIDDENSELDNITTELRNISGKYDVIETEMQTFSEKYDLIETRVDVLYQASLWIIMLLGLISGILFVLVFTGSKKK